MRSRLATIIVAPLLVAAAFLLAAAQPGRAQQLVTGVSDDTVSIQSTFTGTKLVVFGTIEGEDGAALKQANYDIAVVVRGPHKELTARKKSRVAGIWVNRDSLHYASAPSYLAVLSNRPLDEIADKVARTGYRLGLDNIDLRDPTTPEGEAAPPNKLFDAAVVRLMRERELYVEDPMGVTFLSPALFKAEVRLPANIFVGTYAAEVYLFLEGALIAERDVNIEVRKTGLEQIITSFATNLPLLYGLTAVAMAILSGWLANIIFRRD